MSAAAILRSSSISLDIKFFTPSDGRTTSFKCLMLSFERDCIRLAPLTIVFATSKAKIEILFPFVDTPDVKPLLRFKFVILLPSVSKTSTALPSPAVPALPKSELTSDTCNTPKDKIKSQSNPLFAYMGSLKDPKMRKGRGGERKEMVKNIDPI